jgi:WD40 repeat protein
MSEVFDPCYEWLGIQPKDQPPNYYRLLGIELFESNLNVIERAADRQMAHVRTFQSGKRSRESQALLNQLSAARVCLLNDEKRADYDSELQAQLVESLPQPLAAEEPVLPEPIAAVDQAADVANLRSSERPHSTSVSRKRRRKAKPQRLAIMGVAVIVVVLGLFGLMFGHWMFIRNEAPGQPAPNSTARVESPTPAPTPNKAESNVVAEASEPAPEVTPKANRPPDPPPETTPPPTAPEATPPKDTSIAVASITPINEWTNRPADPRPTTNWPPLQSSLRRQIEDATGMVTDDFAICQDMPFNECVQACQQMRRYGYRPIRFRPYVVEDDEVHVAAVWTRDGLPWRLIAGTIQEPIATAQQNSSAAGFEPVDLAGFYLWKPRQAKFAAIWVNKEGPVPPSEIWIAVSSKEFGERLKKLENGLTAYVRNWFSLAGIYRYSVIWKPKPAGVTSQQRYGGSIATFESRVKPNDHLLDIAVVGSAEHGHVVGASFVRGLPPTVMMHSLSPEDHLRKFQPLAARGLRPVSVSVARKPDKSLVSASVWVQPQGANPPTANVASAMPADSRTAKATHALRFDGRDSVVLSNSRGLADLNKTFTAEMWFRSLRDMTQPAHCLVGNCAMSGFHPEVNEPSIVGWVVSAGRLRRDNTTGASVRWSRADGILVGVSGRFPPLNDAWHHLAVCNEPQSDGGWQMQVFVDGKFVQRVTRPATEVFPSPSDLFLGSSEFVKPDNTFHGDIRAFHLSSTVRYETPFTPRDEFMPDNDTIALLNFDGGDSRAVRDISGNNHNARIVGADWIEVSAAPNMTAAAPPERPLTTKRLVVPPPEEREAASILVKQTFKSEFTGARNPSAKVALAGDLRKQATEEPKAATKFALFYESRNLAIEAVDAHLALRVTDELADWFDVQIWTLRVDTVSKLAGAVKEDGGRRTLVELVMGIANDALANDEFDAASKLLGSVSRLNARLKDRELSKTLNQLNRQVSQGKKRWQDAEEATRVLAETPDDADANLAVGRYRCFVKGDWEAGLPHLLKGGDDTLKELAARDQEQPTDGSDCLAVASAWYDWGEDARAADRNGAWLRAQHWYNQALPKLSGLERTQASKRLEEIAGKVISASGTSTQLAWLDAPVGEIKRLSGHTAEITCLAVTRSGKSVVSASADDTIRTWDLATGKQTGRIRSSMGGIRAIALSPDDRFVCVAGSSSTVEIWNLKTGQPATSIKTKSSARDMVLSGDGRHLLYARGSSGSGNLQVFEMGTGRQVGELNCPSYPRSVALSRNGRLAAAAARGGDVFVWNLATRKMAAPFSGLSNDASDVELSPNERLVAACRMNEIMIWELSSGKVVATIQAPRYAYRLAFSPDSRRLLTAGQTNQVTIWDVSGGTEIRTLTGNAGNLVSSSSTVAYLPDARGAVSGGYDRLIRVWRLPD